MLGNKRSRKNYHKSRFVKRRVHFPKNAISCLKILVGIAVVTGMSSVFVFSHDLLTQCDFFRADKVIVQGAHRLSAKQVISQARIDTGINILSVNLATARKRLLAHSWISEANVRRELPNSIYIRICEQKPLAILDLGRKFIINSQGEIFKEWTTSDPGNFPIIKGLEFSDIQVSGKPHSVPFKAVMDVLQLGQKSESILPNRLIKRIQVDRETGLTLYTLDDRNAHKIKAVKIGYDDYVNKYTKLKDVLFYMKKKRGLSDCDSIDLNNPNRIVVVNPVRVESTTEDQKEVYDAKKRKYYRRS